MTRWTNSLFQFRLQQPAQLLFRAVQLHFYRPKRKIERFRQVFVSHPLQVVRRDHQPVIGRQSRDRFLQTIAQLEIAELPVGRAWRGTRSAIVVQRLGPGRFAVILQTDVRDDAINPCRQACLPAKIGKPAMHAQEDILRQILRPRSILYRAGD